MANKENGSIMDAFKDVLSEGVSKQDYIRFNKAVIVIMIIVALASFYIGIKSFL